MPREWSPAQFRAVYYGSVTLDRRYTPAMLPWTLSEVRLRGRRRNRNDRKSVIVTVGRNSLIATIDDAYQQQLEHGGIVFEHDLNKIRRFVQEPTVGSVEGRGEGGSPSANRHFFAYLTRESEEAPIQCCHVFELHDNITVRDMFSVLREATAEAASRGQTHPAAAENSAQRFEILYVGKIKVSHCKAPPTFVDEAVERFRIAERDKLKQLLQNSTIDDDKNSSSSRSPLVEERFRRRSANSDLDVSPSSTCIHETDVACEPPASDCHDFEVNGGSSASDRWSSTENVSSVGLHDGSQDSGVVLSSKTLAKCESVSTPPPPPPTPPLPHFYRSLAGYGDASSVFSNGSPRGGQRRRTRTDSITCGQNRTMVFQIGASDVSFVSLDKKSTGVSKAFQDIAHCSQGIKHKDHFGFICRDSNSEEYFGYILKCQSPYVAEEIMTTLKQVFASAAAQKRALRRQFVICDACPMLWLHKLCVELEGLSICRAHEVIVKRLDTLTVDEKTDVLAKLEGVEICSTREKNEVLMMLLRALCEVKQTRHVHMDLGKCNKHDHPSPLLGGLFERKHSSSSTSVIDDLKNKARRSLSSSFETILKRKTKSSSREGFRERSHTLDFDSRRDSSGACTPEPSSPGSTPDRSHEFPSFETSGRDECPEFRRRSSTIADAREARRSTTRVAKQKTSPMMSIFMKVGNPNLPKAPSTPSSDDERWSTNAGKTASSTPASVPLTVVTPQRKHSGSWRQAIFNRVVTPQHKSKDALENMSPRLSSSPGLQPIRLDSQLSKKSPETLRFLWRKAIRQQILLIRMERENRKLKASQDAAQVKRLKLSYEEITPCLVEITKVWEEMLRTPKSSRIAFDDLVAAIKAGVPRQRRGDIWQLLAGQHKMCIGDAAFDEQKLPAPYEDLIKELTAQQHAILIDLGRTFPSHPYFTDSLGAGQLSLFNLLKAYSLLDTEVGYCQGLSFIAGVLLLHMEEDMAFDMLNHLMFTLGIRRQFRPDMVALQIQMYQLSRLIHDHHRGLYGHFEKYEIAPTLYAAPWFLTLFASQFPLGFVARVFDLIFLFGMEVAFKVALVLLGNHKELIMQCNSFESVMEFLKTTLPSMGIIQMERIFNQVFSMDISRQLVSYEVEYNVLQEEMVAGNQTYRDMEYDYELTIRRLEQANDGLKRQNAELLAELHVTRDGLMTLERQISSYQACTSRQESRLKVLAQERATLRQLVETLRRNWPSEHYDVCNDCLSGYEDVLRSGSPPPTLVPPPPPMTTATTIRHRHSLYDASASPPPPPSSSSDPLLLPVSTRARNVSGESLCSSQGSIISSEIHTD